MCDLGGRLWDVGGKGRGLKRSEALAHCSLRQDLQPVLTTMKFHLEK